MQILFIGDIFARCSRYAACWASGPDGRVALLDGLAQA